MPRPKRIGEKPRDTRVRSERRGIHLERTVAVDEMIARAKAKLARIRNVPVEKISQSDAIRSALNAYVFGEPKPE